MTTDDVGTDQLYEAYVLVCAETGIEPLTFVQYVALAIALVVMGCDI